MIDYSIIIAAPEWTPDLPVLASLRECGLDPARYEIFVATGHQPARQRNAALAQAQGEVIVFLDSDCVVTPAYFQRLYSQLHEHNADVLGGPVLLLHEKSAPTLQRIFQTAFGHRLAVGKTASRYASHGVPRPCGDAELILCNLAVRRSLFQQAGLFNESLYPNEENEWLDRVLALGKARLWHDPGLTAHRPQRATWEAFIQMLLRYGAGRTRQTLISRHVTAKSLPLAALLLWFGLTWVARPEMSALTCIGSFAYLLLIATTAPGRLIFSLREHLQVGLAAVITLFGYATGQLLGLVGWPPPHPAAQGEVTVHRV